jgi:hypothetical protein
MTIRKPVSAQQNIWFDAQQVDNVNLSLEQTYNTTIDSSLINNHIGSGVLPNTLSQNVIFDSYLYSSGFLDGLAILPQNQPSDSNLGNILSVGLTGSNVCGKKHVKVCVIGLDFQSNLQFETFTFKINETQVGSKHFTSVLLILFNDFIGDPNVSLNLGGRVLIQEAVALEISRSTIMIAQDLQPNLFFRDFYCSNGNTLNSLLQSALPYYNTSTLGIYSSVLQNNILAANDVTTQIGEKFLLTVNNIQKITLLLAVQNTLSPTNLQWTGDLIISIYPLQSINSYMGSDIIPPLPIEYQPYSVPLAQLSINYNSLLSQGYTLGTVPQPIDFVFSNTPVASGNVLTVGNYYAVTLKRSGAANNCDILIATGQNLIENSMVTVFSSNLWVDIPEQNLWFQVYTDSIQVADGQAYDSGNGAIIPKTYLDPNTNTTEDYILNNIPFYGSDTFSAVFSAVTQESSPVPDPRTGNPVDSIQQEVPQVSLLSVLDLSNLEKTSEPLVLGNVTDTNLKSYSPFNILPTANLHSFTLSNNEIVIKIIEDRTDPRFDQSVIELKSSLLNGDFVGAQITPNTSSPLTYYRISSAELCSMILGDVNGDGVVDGYDLTLLSTYIGINLNQSPPLNSIISNDGYVGDGYFINGYLTLTNPFVNASGLTFQLINAVTHLVVASGSDGVLVADPNVPTLGYFSSNAVLFNTYIGLSGYNLIITDTNNTQNCGGFNIVSLNSIENVLTIEKILLTGDSLCSIMRADIDGDFSISYNDSLLLNDYINRVKSISNNPTPYPSPTTNAYKNIGTRFNVIRFKVEAFQDRNDDYYGGILSQRADTLHLVPDIFFNDGYFAQHDFFNHPSLISFSQQLIWEDYLVNINSNPKLVPCAFTDLSGYTEKNCQNVLPVQITEYPAEPTFDPGIINYFVPNNLVVGGNLINTDNSFYKVDFEVGTIILELPSAPTETIGTIDIVNNFVAEYYTGGVGYGMTRLGFPAMKFADCTYVGSDCLINNQIRFSVSLQSYVPIQSANDGYCGLYMYYDTGLLTIDFNILYNLISGTPLNNKIQVEVYLKKGGFNNNLLYVDSNKMKNILSY